MTALAEFPTKGLQLGILTAGLGVGISAGVDPKLAVVGALGIAFVLLVLSDLAVGVALFAFVSFLDVLPSGGAAVSFAKLAGLLLSVSWFATVTTGRQVADFVRTHPIPSYLLLALAGWSAISAVWAEDAGTALDHSSRLALNMVLLLIVFTAVRRRRDLMWVVGAFIVGVATSALYGFVAPPPPPRFDIPRLGGAAADPNELAALLAPSLAITIALAAGWRASPGRRLLALAAIPFFLVAILLTFSRGGLVALGVTLIVSVVLGGRWRLRAFWVVVGVAATALICAALLTTPDQRGRVLSFGTDTGRTDIWQVGWRMVEAQPAQGVGAGNFRVSSIHYLLEPGAIPRDEFIVDTPKVAHNMYLEVLAELGLVGLLLFVLIIGFSLKEALRAARIFERVGDRQMELLGRSLVVGLAGLLVADFFLSGQYSKQLWLLLALGPCLGTVARREEAAKQGARLSEPSLLLQRPAAATA